MHDRQCLSHFGILGMKWGVRKDSSSSKPSSKPYIKNETKTITTKLKNGETLTMSGQPTPAIAKFLSRYFKGARENVNNASYFQLRDSKNKPVGDMQLFKESKTSLNITWVGVSGDQRGKGYASAAMRGAVNFAKSEGLKTVTLEVPGHSPDARHIYEKMGFKLGKQITKDDSWGGLTEMQLDLKDYKS